jgi:hypothetical protein
MLRGASAIRSTARLAASKSNRIHTVSISFYPAKSNTEWGPRELINFIIILAHSTLHHHRDGSRKILWISWKEAFMVDFIHWYSLLGCHLSCTQE